MENEITLQQFSVLMKARAWLATASFFSQDMHRLQTS
jgi:hypothetical protein